MNPVALTILQALFTLGPQVADAVVATIKAAHGQQMTDEDHRNIGQAIAQVLAKDAK
jgi:hypothetical protein